jgi:hypothetical protein
VQTTAASCGLQGAFKNLKLTNGATASTQVAVTADVECLSNGSATYAAKNVSLTISTACTGAANCLDAGSVAVSTFYSVWVIYNGTTVAGLLSTSATSPTLPSGYTYSARVGWVRTNASSNLLGILQLGRKVQYIVGTNLTGLPLLVSGAVGNPGTPTYNAVSVAPLVPSTAASIHLMVQSSATSTNSFLIAPNANYGGPFSTTNPPHAEPPSSSSQNSHNFEMMLESTSIYVAMQANNQIYVIGWDDNL